MTNVIHKNGVTNLVSSIPIKKQIEIFSTFGVGMCILVMRGSSHNPRTPQVTCGSGWGG